MTWENSQSHSEVRQRQFNSFHVMMLTLHLWGDLPFALLLPNSRIQLDITNFYLLDTDFRRIIEAMKELHNLQFALVRPRRSCGQEYS